MLDHEEVQLPAGKHMFDVLKEHLAHRGIDGVKQHRVVVQEQIGVVGNAVGDGIHPLKHSQPAVIATHPPEIVGNLAHTVHKKTPFGVLLFYI